jgi:glucose-6-phosphate isomerase
VVFFIEVSSRSIFLGVLRPNLASCIELGFSQGCGRNAEFNHLGEWRPRIEGDPKGTGVKLREPGVCRVDVAKGELVGATNHYVKTLADLEGLYEDETAFCALRRELGDPLVYEVTDFKPSSNPGDMIFGVTRMCPGKVGRE